MTFTVKLDNSYRLIATILGAAVLGTAFVWLIVSSFIIRVAADTRVALSRETLVAASSRFPNSPRVYFRLADTEIADATSKGQFDAQAEMHAMRAVNLSPWDYQARRLLAVALELNNKPEESENALRAAVKLAPNHAELNWMFANLLLRRGKLNEAIEPFRVASKSNLDLLQAAIETIWQSSGGNLDTLKSFAANDTDAQLSIVKFLTGQKLVNEAVSIFNAVDKRARVNSSRCPELIGVLINARQFDLARNIWLEAVTTLQPASQSSQPASQPAGGLVWNGSFEADSVKDFNHFDWIINPNQYARIGIDRSFARTGARALKVAFSGLDTTTLRYEVKQLLSLKSGVRYRLECYAKPVDLVTPAQTGGPRVAITGLNGLIAVSEPVAAGSTDWQHLVVDFVAPADASSVLLTVVRIPKFSYDDPTKGIVWFDDFTLVEQ